MRKNVVVSIIYDVVIEDTDLKEQMKVEESIKKQCLFFSLFTVAQLHFDLIRENIFFQLRAYACLHNFLWWSPFLNTSQALDASFNNIKLLFEIRTLLIYHFLN